MGSSSHLLKTAKGSEFRAQVDYNYDRVSAHGASSTTYFLESGDKIIFENKNSRSRRDAITGKFIYEANEKTYFLNNTLSTDISWNDLTLNTIGSIPNIQSAQMPEYSVSNLLKIIKRFGNNKLVTFASRNEWNSIPEKLTINRNGNSYGQNIKQHSLYTDERASLGFVFNKVLLSLDAGLSGYFRKLNTDLFGVDMADMVGAEALTTDYLRVFVSPKFEWSYQKLELTLNVPVNVYSYFFSGVMNNRTELFLSPSLAARYRFTPRLSLTVRGSARRSPASLHDIHTSSILTDYRSFSSGVDDYYTSSGQSLSATVQELINDYVFYSYKSMPSDSRNAMAYFNVSKTIDFVRGAIGLKGNYMRMENSLLSQGSKTAYTNDSFSLSPFVNGNISTLFNWNFRFTWGKSMLRISDMPKHSSNNFIYSGSMTVTPCSLITWTTGGEFYRNQIEEGHYKKMFILDTKLTFNISKRIEVSASITNLLNKKEYSYTSYGTLSKYERSNKLRGREFMISIYLKK